MGNKQSTTSTDCPESGADNDSKLKCKENVVQEPEHRQISVLIVGAGMRGQIYASYASDFPQRMKVVGVAEPIMHRRDMMQKLHKVDESHVFCDWKDVSL